MGGGCASPCAFCIERTPPDLCIDLQKAVALFVKNDAFQAEFGFMRSYAAGVFRGLLGRGQPEGRLRCCRRISAAGACRWGIWRALCGIGASGAEGRSRCCRRVGVPCARRRVGVTGACRWGLGAPVQRWSSWVPRRRVATAGVPPGKHTIFPVQEK